MKIGKGVSIAVGANLDVFYPQLITIEDGAILGIESMILTHEHTVKKIRVGRVHIGKQALVGLRSIVRSGVSIGDFSAVCANSFVNRDVKVKELVGGSPIRHIRTLSELM